MTVVFLKEREKKCAKENDTTGRKTNQKLIAITDAKKHKNNK